MAGVVPGGVPGVGRKKKGGALGPVGFGGGQGALGWVGPCDLGWAARSICTHPRTPRIFFYIICICIVHQYFCKKNPNCMHICLDQQKLALA